jgi:hypothetical protein
LLANVAQRVCRPTPITFVQHDEIGEINHVDLFELRGRTVFRRHHVQRAIDLIDDLGVALANARSLEKNEVKAGGAKDQKSVSDGCGEGKVGATRRHRAHENRLAADGIHSDPIAEERAAAAPPRRIDQQERNSEVGGIASQASDEFIDDARFARAAGTREADHGRPRRRRFLDPRTQRRRVVLASFRVILEERKQTADIEDATLRQSRSDLCETRHRIRLGSAPRFEAFLDDAPDHSL